MEHHTAHVSRNRGYPSTSCFRSHGLMCFVTTENLQLQMWRSHLFRAPLTCFSCSSKNLHYTQCRVGSTHTHTQTHTYFSRSTFFFLFYLSSPSPNCENFNLRYLQSVSLHTSQLCPPGGGGVFYFLSDRSSSRWVKISEQKQ